MDSSNAKIFKDLVTVASALRAEVASRQVSLIRTRVLPKLVEQITASKAPYKRLYETVHNSFSAMADGIKSSDVGKGEYQEFMAELSNIATRAADLETAPIKVTRSTAAVDSELWLEQQTQNAAKVMRLYRKWEPLAPRTLAKKFYATRLPVIPLTNPVLNHEALSKLRMLENTLFGYPIITKQVFLGLNSDWVTSDYKRDLQEAIQDVLDVLKGQTGKRYYVLGEPKLRGSVYWCWLVTDFDMARLNKSTHSGHFALKSWSFPFEPDSTLKGSR